MRRLVSGAAATSTAAIVTAWRGTAPAMGALATWHSAYFHSSKFFGRKSGGSKKLGAGASINTATGASSPPPSPAPTAATDASGGSVGAGEGSGAAPAKEHHTTPVDLSAPTNNNNVHQDGRTSMASPAMTSGKGGAATAKKARVSQRRKPVQNSEERAASPENLNDTTCFSKQEPTSMKRVAADGGVSVEPDEEDVVVERASITKLFMLSDSVASIFCALPQNQRSIDNYLREVDQAVLPPSASDQRAGGTGNVMHGDDDCTGQSNEAVARREIAERVLSEERANHTLCIHVRDMDQLVPPPDLLLSSAAKEPTRAAATGGSRRRKVSREGKKSGAVANASLTPIERILALHEWQMKALEKARGSQERFKVPDDYHAITRVRFHDPPRADLTVVQGSGCAKTVADVLATMDRSLNNDANTDDDREHDIFDGREAADDEGGATLLSKPFALKPLLSVVASCIPRREPALGSRCGEEMFFSSRAAPATFSGTTAVAATRRTKRAKRADSEAAKPVNSAKVGVEFLGRRVPPMPRFTTRVTVLVEHDELEPVDLLSMAERSTTRKDDADNKKSASRKRRVPRIYCHIADGGEY